MPFWPILWLRAQLAPLMRVAGFSPLKGATLGWTRESAKGPLGLWFEANQWGWNARWGSTFTVEFQRPPQGRQERIGYLLEGFPELDELRVRNNAVIGRLPGLIAGEWVSGKLPDGSEYLIEGYKVDPDRAIYGRDLWLNYYSLDDAREWASYFAGKLPRFISLFDNETRSEQGEASLRFHRAMARVQSARERQEKAAILEERKGCALPLRRRAMAAPTALK